eukprot:699044-Prymnesium_polylepis.1
MQGRGQPAYESANMGARAGGAGMRARSLQREGHLASSCRSKDRRSGESVSERGGALRSAGAEGWSRTSARAACFPLRIEAVMAWPYSPCDSSPHPAASSAVRTLT